MNPLARVPGKKRIDAWEKGDYAHVQAGDDADEWNVGVTGPVREDSDQPARDVRTAQLAVAAALDVIRAREGRRPGARALGRKAGR